MSGIARTLHALGLAVWLGALSLVLWLWFQVEGVVASEHLAQAVALSALRGVESWGLLVSGPLVITLFVGWSTPGRGRFLGLALLVGMLLLTRFWLHPYFEEVRLALGRPVESLGPSDPGFEAYMWSSAAIQVGVGLQWFLVLWLLWKALRPPPTRRYAGISL